MLRNAIDLNLNRLHPRAGDMSGVLAFPLWPVVSAFRNVSTKPIKRTDAREPVRGMPVIHQGRLPRHRQEARSTVGRT